MGLVEILVFIIVPITIISCPIAASRQYKKKTLENNGFYQKKLRAEKKNTVLTVNGPFPPSLRSYLEKAIAGSIESSKIGEVLGGKCIYKEQKEVAYNEIYLHLKSDNPKLIDSLAAFFDKNIKLPKGSVLQGKRNAVPVGVLSGLGLYFNTLSLPDNDETVQAYKDMLEKICTSLGDKGSPFCTWVSSDDVDYNAGKDVFEKYREEHPPRMAVYYYGSSFAEMKEIIEPIIKDSPFSSFCEIVRMN